MSDPTGTSRALRQALVGRESGRVAVPQCSRLWGVVTAVTGGSVTVTISGSSVAVPGVKYLSSYAPVVNDVVVIEEAGGDLIVVGKLSTAAGGFPKPLLTGSVTGAFPITQNFTVTRPGSSVTVDASATCYTTTAGNLIGLNYSLDSGTVTACAQLYFNNASLHATLPTAALLFLNLTAASHSIVWSLSGTGASSDTNDRLNYRFMEILP